MPNEPRTEKLTMMETFYKKLRSAKISSSTYRILYKDQTSNEDLPKSSEGLLESEDNETLDSDVRPRKEKRSLTWGIVVHSFIFATYTIGMFAATGFLRHRPGTPTLVYSKWNFSELFGARHTDLVNQHQQRKLWSMRRSFITVLYSQVVSTREILVRYIDIIRS